MQSDNKEIYKLTSERTQKSEEVYKTVGSFVFAELQSMLRRPTSLIIKLKGVGFWYLRKKRLHIMVDMFPPNFEKKREDFSSEDSFLKNENKKEIYNLFKERLKEYEKYVELKSEIRKERNKTQVPIKPKEDES